MMLGSMRTGGDNKSAQNGEAASNSIQPVSPKVQEELTYLVREIKLLQSLKHPSLCELREYYLSAQHTPPCAIEHETIRVQRVSVVQTSCSVRRRWKPVLLTGTSSHLHRLALY